MNPTGHKASKSWVRQKTKLKRVSYPMKNKFTKSQRYLLALLLFVVGVSMSLSGCGMLSYIPTICAAVLIATR